MPTYILRTIPPELWARVKARSESDQIPLRAVILALLDLYASRRVDVTSSTVATKAP